MHPLRHGSSDADEACFEIINNRFLYIYCFDPLLSMGVAVIVLHVCAMMELNIDNDMRNDKGVKK